MSNAYTFTLPKLGGGELPLSQFQGKPILLVNVASKCGLTPQYSALERLYRTYQGKGLSIVGVPCNQFMQQEPGTDAEIQSFCSTQYDVSFPLAGKIEVNGEGRHPLYAFLAGEGAQYPGDIQWNFEKFLLGKNGEVLARFSPRTEPDAAEVIAAIEAAL